MPTLHVAFVATQLALIPANTADSCLRPACGMPGCSTARRLPNISFSWAYETSAFAFASASASFFLLFFVLLPAACFLQKFAAQRDGLFASHAEAAKNYRLVRCLVDTSYSVYYQLQPGLAHMLKKRRCDKGLPGCIIRGEADSRPPSQVVASISLEARDKPLRCPLLVKSFPVL